MGPYSGDPSQPVSPNLGQQRLLRNTSGGPDRQAVLHVSWARRDRGGWGARLFGRRLVVCRSTTHTASWSWPGSITAATTTAAGQIWVAGDAGCGLRQSAGRGHGRPLHRSGRTVAPTLSAGGVCGTWGGLSGQPGQRQPGHTGIAPSSGPTGANPVFTYNAGSTGATELGNGWTHTFSRQVIVGGSGTPIVSTGTGQFFDYGSNLAGGFYPSGQGTVNSLYGPARFTSFTETQTDGTVYRYGGGPPTARLFSIQPASGGGRWSATYDGSGRVSRITDPFGGKTSFIYSTGGKIRRILEPSGRITRVTVNAGGNLARITSPELCITSLVYDASNRATAWFDPLGNRTSYSYDGSNRITRLITPVGQRVSMTYQTNKTVVTDPRGIRTTLGFNGGGYQTSAIDGTGIRTSYGYDANNMLTKVQDGLGRLTSFTYVKTANQVEQLSAVVTPLGSRFTYLYDTNSRVRAVLDPLNNRSTLLWDGNGNRTAVIDPTGKRTSYLYNTAGQATGVISSLGQRVTSLYDTSGRVAAFIDTLGNRTSFGYDANNQVKRLQNPLARSRRCSATR